MSWINIELLTFTLFGLFILLLKPKQNTTQNAAGVKKHGNS